MRVIVSGGKGFIGSVLCTRWAELGHEIIALDDCSRGLNRIEDNAAVTFRQHDCMAGLVEGLPSFIRDQPVDVVVHLAAATGSLERPLEELRAFNVEMMLRVYQDAVALGAKCFLWPTTSLAIGVPDSPYVQSKEEGLAALLEADQRHGIAQPVRFFNVAGAYRGMSEYRRNEVHLLPMMAEHALQGTTLVVNGVDYGETQDGSPGRDFVNVVDVVDYLKFIADRMVYRELPRLPVANVDRAVWVGTGWQMTVLQVVELWNRVFTIPLTVERGPRRAYDCWGLMCDEHQSAQFSAALRGTTPARVSIMEEWKTLLGRATLGGLR